MEVLAKQIGRTVRSALTGWPQTVRLIAIMAAATVLIAALQLLP